MHIREIGNRAAVIVQSGSAIPEAAQLMGLYQRNR